MNLPNWCRTHSFKEFLEMMENNKENNMTDHNQMNDTPVETMDAFELPAVDGKDIHLAPVDQLPEGAEVLYVQDEEALAEDHAKKAYQTEQV